MTPTSILTYTGRTLDLVDPKPDAVDIVDIAHALSLINRYNGHTEYAYSVAQHSCVVHDLVVQAGWDGDVALWALLHDAHEAYLGDISSPLKRVLGGLGVMEDAIDVAIADALGIGDIEDVGLRAIKHADRVAYAWERRDVAAVGDVWDVGDDLEVPEDKLLPWSAAEAETAFLVAFDGYRSEECDHCGGTGGERWWPPAGLGLKVGWRPCQACDGTGRAA